jgi:hypothetical protein
VFLGTLYLSLYNKQTLHHIPTLQKIIIINNAGSGSPILTRWHVFWHCTSKIAAVITATGGGEPNEVQLQTLISDVEGKDVEIKGCTYARWWWRRWRRWTQGCRKKQVEEEVEEDLTTVDSTISICYFILTTALYTCVRLPLCCC